MLTILIKFPGRWGRQLLAMNGILVLLTLCKPGLDIPDEILQTQRPGMYRWASCSSGWRWLFPRSRGGQTRSLPQHAGAAPIIAGRRRIAVEDQLHDDGVHPDAIQDSLFPVDADFTESMFRIEPYARRIEGKRSEHQFVIAEPSGFGDQMRKKC